MVGGLARKERRLQVVCMFSKESKMVGGLARKARRQELPYKEVWQGKRVGLARKGRRLGYQLDLARKQGRSLRFDKERETVQVYCSQFGKEKERRYRYYCSYSLARRNPCTLHTTTDVGFLYTEIRRLQSNFLSRHHYSQFNSTKDDTLLSPGNIRPGSLLFSNTQDPRSEKTKNAWLLKYI